MKITEAAVETGFNPINLIESPIKGAEGNREFLIHLKKAIDASADKTFIDERIIRLSPQLEMWVACLSQTYAIK